MNTTLDTKSSKCDLRSVQFACPNLSLKFVVFEGRLKRITQFLMEEAMESERELVKALAIQEEQTEFPQKPEGPNAAQ